MTELRVPAVVAAGDLQSATWIAGESKPYLELAGQPLVSHAVSLLQRVPEVSEVWVVGDSARLEALLCEGRLGGELQKPLHLISQFENLYENAWQSYRRLLPGAPPEGRDPATPEDLDQPVLYLSADIPFATPEEVSAFARTAATSGSDYVLGLCSEASMEGFRPQRAGDPGIELATFNLREGRFRQSNLHWVRPARLGHRQYIEDMYEQRHQRRVGPILRLAWRLLVAKGGGASVLFYYALMHLASMAHLRGLLGLADFLRARIRAARVERGCGGLIGAPFRMVVTEVGGSAVDIDTEADYRAAIARYDEWRAAQRARAASHPEAAYAAGAGGRARVSLRDPA